MKNKRFLAASFLIVLLFAARAWAGHVAWIDFSGFHLESWTEVNGKPPEATDLEAIKKLIVANVSEDYATFDITITTSQPASGRYTRVSVLGFNGNGKYGCSGAACCEEGNCTENGSWETVTESGCEVYAGSFSNNYEALGPNATTARLARGIAGSVSHELGHILGLEHCHAAADSLKLGCENTAAETTNDKNMLWHVMASGKSWGLTKEQQVTRDRFFSPHSERRILAGNLQLRNHFAPLPNLNAGGGRADLLYGRLYSPKVVKWYARTSNGSVFSEPSVWAGDAGDAGDIFLSGDVNDDDRADLVFGRIQSQGQVTWYVRLSNGDGFDPYTEWSADAGDPGDIFRLADVNKDGQADLVYGRAIDADTVRWFVRKSTGSSFGNYSVWSNDAGRVGDLFFVADIDNDDRADLVYAQAVSPTQVKWFVRRSDGNEFGSFEIWKSDAGQKGDLMYVGDVTGDGAADLVYGHVTSTAGVSWHVRPSTGYAFGDAQTWANDAGDSGDLFRLGDATGDGKLDLMYGRPVGMVSPTATPNLARVRWYGRSSQGTSFSSVSVWKSDAGDEGDCFP